MAHFPEMPQERFYRQATVEEIVDGDTLDVRIDLGWSVQISERLRLEKVNTPETRGDEKPAGDFVTDQVKAWLPIGTPVVIASLVFDKRGRIRGKYGRTVAHVYHAQDAWCLNERLLIPDQKMAWETNDQGSLVDPRDLSLLLGVPSSLRGSAP